MDNSSPKVVIILIENYRYSLQYELDTLLLIGDWNKFFVLTACAKAIKTYSRRAVSFLNGFCYRQPSFFL